MAVRAFLKPISAILAALTSASVSANAPTAGTQPPSNAAPTTDATAADAANLPIATNSDRKFSVKQGDDLFSFVLARNADGDYVAYHTSHESHSSHSSHSSHYSSR